MSIFPWSRTWEKRENKGFGCLGSIHSNKPRLLVLPATMERLKTCDPAYTPPLGSPGHTKQASTTNKRHDVCLGPCNHHIAATHSFGIDLCNLLRHHTTPTFPPEKCKLISPNYWSPLADELAAIHVNLTPDALADTCWTVASAWSLCFQDSHKNGKGHICFMLILCYWSHMWKFQKKKLCFGQKTPHMMWRPHGRGSPDRNFRRNFRQNKRHAKTNTKTQSSVSSIRLGRTPRTYYLLWSLINLVNLVDTSTGMNLVDTSTEIHSTTISRYY